MSSAYILLHRTCNACISSDTCRWSLLGLFEQLWQLSCGHATHAPAVIYAVLGSKPSPPSSSHSDARSPDGHIASYRAATLSAKRRHSRYAHGERCNGMTLVLDFASTEDCGVDFFQCACCTTAPTPMPYREYHLASFPLASHHAELQMPCSARTSTII